MEWKEIEQQVKEGDYCPLKFLSELKDEIETLTAIKGRILTLAIDEIKTTGTNQYSKYGLSFEVGQKVTYDYKSNPIWLQINENKKDIEENMKLKFKGASINEETGEDLTNIPLPTQNLSELFITIKKIKS